MIPARADRRAVFGHVAEVLQECAAGPLPIADLLLVTRAEEPPALLRWMGRQHPGAVEPVLAAHAPYRPAGRDELVARLGEPDALGELRRELARGPREVRVLAAPDQPWGAVVELVAEAWRGGAARVTIGEAAR